MTKKYNFVIYITIFFIVIAISQIYGQGTTEVPGITNISNKINAVASSVSTGLFRGITVIALLIFCGFGYMMKWNYKLLISVCIASILVNIIGTVVDFVFSA